MKRLVAALRRAAPYWLPALVLLAAILFVFWRIWTPLEGERRTFGWDAVWEYWGDITYQLDSLGDLEAPLWNPYDRTGYPFHADPQAGTLYPVQWLIWLCGAIAGPVYWLVSLKIVLHFWIAALGTYALCARRGLSTPARYFAALSVITSYAMFHNVFSALNWSFAWTPWLLLAVDAWTSRPTRGTAAIAALVAGLTALAGGLAAFWYALLVAIPWAVVGLVEARRAAMAAGQGDYLRRLMISALWGGGLFLLLVAAQFDATGHLVGDTVRDERGVRFFGTTVFDAVDVVGFFVPRSVGENVYLGFGPILWAATAVSLRPSPRNLVLCGVFALAVLCALGDRGPVLPALASVLGPFELFQRAHRYLYVAVVPVAILAAEGLALLTTVEGETRAKTRRMVIAATAVMVIICGVGFAVKTTYPWKPDLARDAFGWGLGATLVGGWLTWMVATYRGPLGRALFFITVVVAAVDIWVARAFKLEHPNMVAVPNTASRDQAIRKLPDLPLGTRIYDYSWASFRPGIRLQVRDFGGYEGDPLALSRYARLRDQVAESVARVGHAGVTYLLEGTPGLRRAVTSSGSVLEPMRDIGPGAHRITAVAPTVAWYDSAVLAANAREALSVLLAATPGSQAVLERDRLSASEVERALKVDGEVPRVDGKLVALGRNRLTAEVLAPADGVVVILEAWLDRGWSATVDGAPARLFPANSGFRGLFVGPGRHVIAMEYRANRYLLLSALVPLALALIGFLVWRERRSQA